MALRFSLRSSCVPSSRSPSIYRKRRRRANASYCCVRYALCSSSSSPTEDRCRSFRRKGAKTQRNASGYLPGRASGMSPTGVPFPAPPPVPSNATCPRRRNWYASGACSAPAPCQDESQMNARFGANDKRVSQQEDHHETPTLFNRIVGVAVAVCCAQRLLHRRESCPRTTAQPRRQPRRPPSVCRGPRQPTHRQRQPTICRRRICSSRTTGCAAS